jgi:hypothetical protein
LLLLLQLLLLLLLLLLPGVGGRRRSAGEASVAVLSGRVSVLFSPHCSCLLLQMDAIREAGRRRTREDEPAWDRVRSHVFPRRGCDHAAIASQPCLRWRSKRWAMTRGSKTTSRSR